MIAIPKHPISIWVRYSLFLGLCLALVMESKIHHFSAYPFGFRSTDLAKKLVPFISAKLFTWDETSLKLLLHYLLGMPFLSPQSDILQAHNTFALAHLLSPSAFHLLALSWIIKFFFPRPYEIGFWTLCLLVGLSSTSLHPALIRSIALCLVMSLTTQQNLEKKILIFTAFFALDYWQGTYQLMPLSFIYSFVLLGHLYLLPPTWHFSIRIFLAHAALALLFNQQISIVGLCFGLILSQLFLPLFAAILIYLLLYPFTSFWVSCALNYAFIIFQKMLQYHCDINLPGMSFRPTEIILIVGIIIWWASIPVKKMPYKSMTILALFCFY